MILKNNYLLIFIFLFVLASCEHKKQSQSSLSKDSTSLYIQKALSNQTPYASRVRYTQKAVDALVLQENDSVNRDRLISMCVNFNSLNRWEDLKRVSKTTLVRSQLKEDIYHIAESYRQIGLYYENSSINDSAFYFYSKAEKFYIKANNLSMLCQIIFDKSVIQYYACDFHGSDVNLVKALKIAKKEKFLKIERDCLDQLSQNSIEQNDFKSALMYGCKSLELVKEHRKSFETPEIARSLRSIAFSYYKLNNYRAAIKFYKIALRDRNFYEIYPNTYTNLLDKYAQVNLIIKKYVLSKKLLLLAETIRVKHNVYQGKNYNRLYLSKYYQLTNQNKKAKELAHEAYTLSQSFKNPADILISLKQLIKVDPENALKYSEEYIRVSDSMQQLERVTRNKFAKIAYETEEITQQKNTALKNYRRTWVIASIIIALLILLLIIRAQAAKKRELELKQIQQKANEEISNLMLDQQNKIDTGRSLEKKRIAQDLHDGIMNMLASTRINLHLLVQKTPEETRKNFNRFVNGIQDIEKEIRNIAHDLNHGALANKGSFVGIAEALIQEQKNISICQYHLEIDWQIDWEKMAGYKKIHLYRIMQEALQNILKHAQAKNVEVSMRKTGDCVLMEIFDDGVGFSLKKKKKGLGLQNIIARAKASDAKAVIKTKINQGTTIEITIPIS